MQHCLFVELSELQQPPFALVVRPMMTAIAFIPAQFVQQEVVLLLLVLLMRIATLHPTCFVNRMLVLSAEPMTIVMDHQMVFAMTLLFVLPDVTMMVTVTPLLVLSV